MIISMVDCLCSKIIGRWGLGVKFPSRVLDPLFLPFLFYLDNCLGLFSLKKLSKLLYLKYY